MDKNVTELKRNINWVHGVALTIGAVLGSGVMVLPVLAAQLAGPASLLSWLFMGLLAIPVVTTIGNLARRWPEAGGIAAYAMKAFGRRMGITTGWLFLGTVPIGAPIVALVGAGYLGAYLSFKPFEILLAAALMLLLGIFFNYLGINLSGKVQMIVVGIIALILLLIIFSALPHVNKNAFTPFVPYGWVSVGVSMTLLFLAFVGWEMIGHLSEEFRNPDRDIKLSLRISLIIVSLLYLLLAFVVVGTKSFLEGSNFAAMATLVLKNWGRPAGAIVAVLAYVVCYGSIHTYLAGFSRLVYAQSRQGDFPLFFSKLHTIYQTPHRVLLSLIPVFTIVLGLYYIFNLNLSVLIQFTSAIFIMLYIICMASAIKLLKGQGKNQLYAIISLVVCVVVYLFTGWALIYPFLLGALGWFVGFRQQRDFSELSSKNMPQGF